MRNNKRFYCNVDCEYFPCHEGADPERFNCLFCFCPLYLLGDQCGGSFQYANESGGVKSCVDCKLPHDPAFYHTVIKRLKKRERKGE